MIRQRISKHIKNTGIIIMLIFFISCNSKKVGSCILLPNGKIINNDKVENLEKISPLFYMDYKGFVGSYPDSVLTKFTVLVDNYTNEVGRSVASQEHISSLKQKSFEGIKFEKIPDSVMKFDSVVSYLLRHYPNYSIKGNSVSIKRADKESVFLNAKGDTLVVIQYFSLGIPGTFVTIKSSLCD